MISTVNGATDRYLGDLNAMEARLEKDQAQISSGFRVQQPSDDPAAVGQILQTAAQIGDAKQTQANLAAIKTDTDTADGALQSAIQAVESAISAGAQGASSTASADDRTNLARTVQGILQTLVSITRTTVNGRYIFSGDRDTQPAYDYSQASGVQQLITSSATRKVLDASGTPMPVDKTAQEIFDARNPDGSPAQGNVFAAVSALQQALSTNDTAGITQAMDMLHSADTHLNGQLAFYGNLENRLAQSTDLSKTMQTNQEQSLSQLRDTDVAAVALDLSQLQVQQQAALSAEASISHQKNLFDFLA